MSGTARIERILRALTLVFLVVAFGAFLLPPGVPTLTIVPAGLEVVPVEPSPSSSWDFYATEAVVQANIFSPSRTPPIERYNPFAIEEERFAPTFPDFGFDDPDFMLDQAVVPRLYGTILGPDGRAALMRLDPAMPGARLYREGEGAGGYRIVEIAAEAVVLSGPEGPVLLRLLTPEGPMP